MANAATPVEPAGAAGAQALPKPPWLKVRLGGGSGFARTRRLVRGGGLHTVCEEALCPNRGQCWEHGRATLMILGDACTRACRFCNVASRPPAPPDADEPRRVAEAVAAMRLDEVVITSVTRDDLADGGSAIWAETVARARNAAPAALLEVLIPDFGGNPEALDRVFDARPDVLGHNLETVERLYPVARPQADYRRSLRVLERAARRGLIAKTGIMCGVGEDPDDVLALMRDARRAGCLVFSAGQYLRPDRRHLPVRRYVEPAEFDMYRARGLEMGFAAVVSAPLVRSSLHSDEQTAAVRRLLGAARARTGEAPA